MTWLIIRVLVVVCSVSFLLLWLVGRVPWTAISANLRPDQIPVVVAAIIAVSGW